MANPSIGGRALKRLINAGVKNLAKHVEHINRLNVFPVPDGDTGINMYHTLQRGYREIEPIASDDLSLIAERFAYGALMGARGNSGTILSQLLKGFAEGLDKAPTLTAELFARACEAAVKQGYAAVSEPTEGTILTVAREATERLRGEPGLASLNEMLAALIATAQASLSNTPNLLPILKDAGVVDAGGMGFLCFLEGVQGGRSRSQFAKDLAVTGFPSPNDGVDSYGYDVQFLMIGKRLDVLKTRHDLEQLGWSVIVVGDGGTIKVHIHVENPAIPLDYAIQSGAALDDVVVENMELQYQQNMADEQPMRYQQQPASSDVSVIAVVEGDGLCAVFRDLNCSAIIAGGAGFNPATEDFLAAIEQAASERVIILPNDRNIVLAAQQAADLAQEKLVKVLATETVLQGISAMVAFGDATDGKADFATMLARMRAASGEISSIEITRASRAARFRDLEINENDFIAIVDGKICAASVDLHSVALAAFEALEIPSLELATVYYGAGLPASEADQLIRRLTKSIRGLEFEAVYGGQSLYPFLISVEQCQESIL